MAGMKWGLESFSNMLKVSFLFVRAFPLPGKLGANFQHNQSMEETFVAQQSDSKKKADEGWPALPWLSLIVDTAVVGFLYG